MGSVDTMMDYRRCTCPVLPLSCCCWFTCPMNQSSRTCSPSTGWAVADAGRHSSYAQSVQTGNLLEQLYFSPKSLQSCRPWEAPAAARVAAGVAQAAQLGLGTSLKS